MISVLVIDRPQLDAEALARTLSTLDNLTAVIPRNGEAGIGLSDREPEVLTLIDEGHTTSGIARELVLSPHTVRNHVQRLLEKLDAHSRVETLAVARRHELLPRVAA